MMFVKLGFRNLFRNKRRSFLAASAIGLGFCSAVIADGFMTGMIENMVKLTTSSIIGQGQIHHKKFMEDQSVESVVQDWDQLRSKLEASKEVKHYATRVISAAMIASPKNFQNVALYGINPAQEQHITTLVKHLSSGTFDDPNGVYIGVGLAKKLKISMGEKVILTLSKAYTGELTQEVFRVRGLLNFTSKEMGERMAFLHTKKAQDLIGLKPNEFHEITLSLGDIEGSGDPNNPIWKKLSNETNKAEGWGTLASAIKSVLDMTGSSSLIVAVILGVLIGLGIANTLLMSIFERTFEFGVLRAVGTSTKGIFVMILSESFLLGVVSLVFGGVLTLFFGILMGTKGVDYSGMEFDQITLNEPIKYIFDISHVTVFPAVLLIYVVFIALFPAIHAAKITLTKAMAKSL